LFFQSKNTANEHLGSAFHKYELVWTPKEISFFMDGINYGSLNSSLRESAMAEKIKSSVNWSNNGPFDKEVSAW
jgi:beta-glucanase (GH16 family)